MKKYIIIIVFITLVSSLYSQRFFETSLSTGLLYYAGDLDRDMTYNTKSLGVNFQIGKFKSENKMRSWIFGVKKITSKDAPQAVFINSSGGDVYFDRTISSTAFTIGYDYKSTQMHTEFDDVWNIYTLSYWYLSWVKTSEEFADDNYKKFERSTYGRVKASSFDLGYGIGLGAARKFNKISYAYVEIRGQITLIPNLVTGPYGGYGLPINFGVRRFIN